MLTSGLNVIRRAHGGGYQPARWGWTRKHPTISVIRIFRFTSRGAVWAPLGLVPAAVAAAWIPLRSDLPNTDVAVLLVLCVGAVAMVGGPWAAVIGALAGATAFDLFDAPPYGQLYMTRGTDVVTTLVLVGAGLLVGELCIRTRAYHGIAASRAQDFTVLSTAARLMAVGEDGPMVVEALAGELVTRLGLSDCEFEQGPPPGDRSYVARDGRLVAPEGQPRDAIGDRVDLPVWVGTEVVGHFRLYVSTGPPLSPDRLLAAVGIAEQAGAALAVSHPAPPSATVRPRRLRLIR